MDFFKTRITNLNFKKENSFYVPWKKLHFFQIYYFHFSLKTKTFKEILSFRKFYPQIGRRISIFIVKTGMIIIIDLKDIHWYTCTDCILKQQISDSTVMHLITLVIFLIE